MSQHTGGPVARTGFWSAVLTALLAAISFGVAVTTPPRSGPFAPPGSAIAYPYSGAARFVPRDFLWMYPALLMMLAFLVLAACLRERAAGELRLFGTIGLCLAAISVGVIAVDYFIQLQTVQPGLLRGEGPALAVVSQYNPHGIFITLENLGFLATSLSFAFLALTLGPSRAERAVRWVFLTCSALAVLAFVGMSAYFGFNLEYLFEVAVISLVWLTLIVSGILLAFVFARPADRISPETTRLRLGKKR
ncbi:MAG: hypothetical protein C4521_00100 [Actinobacteria bacterium]|jgi:hypothetical protein|nr:MAG: hypothetical protein C4521_00100 [Actinomycetota bacterium]